MVNDSSKEDVIIHKKADGSVKYEFGDITLVADKDGTVRVEGSASFNEASNDTMQLQLSYIVELIKSRNENGDLPGKEYEYDDAGNKTKTDYKDAEGNEIDFETWINL